MPHLDIAHEQLDDASDVDFLVVFAPDATTTLFDLIHMEESLAAMVGRPVDVVPKRAVEESRNPYRREAILSSYRVLHAA